MKISALDADLVSIASRFIQQGLITIFPTETCYGLGCCGLEWNEDNIRQIYSLKARPFDKPLSLLISKDMIAEFITTTPQIYEFLDAIWPNPVTIVLHSRQIGRSLSPLLNQHNPEQIAFRVPAHRLLKILIETTNCPLIGTSANRAGTSPKYRLDDVLSEIPQSKIHLIIDSGTLPQNPPSTILDLTNPLKPNILRKGALDIQPFINTYLNS